MKTCATCRRWQTTAMRGQTALRLCERIGPEDATHDGQPIVAGIPALFWTAATFGCTLHEPRTE